MGSGAAGAGHPADQFEQDNAPDDPVLVPKSLSTSKIGLTQIASGATAGVVGVAQATQTVIGSVSEVADQVSTVTNKSGSVIETTKTIVAIPKPGFWFHFLHAFTSPAFIPCVRLMIVGAFAMTWFWRRQHARACV